MIQLLWNKQTKNPFTNVNMPDCAEKSKHKLCQVFFFFCTDYSLINGNLCKHSVMFTDLIMG